MTRLLVCSSDHLGGAMSVPAIRALHFARELAGELHVTLSAPSVGEDVVAEGFELRAESADDLSARAASFDAVIAQRLPIAVMAALARSPKQVIYDLYVPFVVEELEMLEAKPATSADRLFAQWATAQQRFALATGNAFVCPNERQRDLWLGVLAGFDRIDVERYRADPPLRDLIDVVPIGVPDRPPVTRRRVLKGVLPGVGESDRVLLWAGGIWNWLDAETPIRAVEQIARRRDDVKLVFLGRRHPRVPETTAARAAVALARSLGVLGRSVFFNDGWVPYEERAAHLLEADLGVSAHRNTLETRYALRTRLLDHLWAGLPTITTVGDELGDLVARRGLGRAVGFGDVAGWAAAIEELLDDGEAWARARTNARAVAEEFAWRHVVRPLARLAALPGSPVGAPTRIAAARVSDVAVRARVSLALGGPAALVRRQARKRVRG